MQASTSFFVVFWSNSNKFGGNSAKNLTKFGLHSFISRIWKFKKIGTETLLLELFPKLRGEVSKISVDGRQRKCFEWKMNLIMCKTVTYLTILLHRCRRPVATPNSGVKIFFGQTSFNIRPVDIFLEEGRTGTLYFLTVLFFLSCVVYVKYSFEFRNPFLADRTIGRAIGTACRLSSVVCLWRFVLWQNGAS